MMRVFLTIIALLCTTSFFLTYGQNTPDIIDGKDYNQSFYIKVKGSASTTYWNNRFPENWVDTSNLVRIPLTNQLKFKGQGTEKSIGFSALFGFRWGKIGGGFEGSRLEIDSLTETIGDTALKISYADSREKLGFNRFFVEFESVPISLTQKSDISLIINLMAGTMVLSPVNASVLLSTSLFVNLGPQLEVPMNRWLSLQLGGYYELRYFNQKEQFFSKKWVFHNTLHSAGVNLSFKFRIYKEDSNKEKPIKSRVQ